MINPCHDLELIEQTNIIDAAYQGREPFQSIREMMAEGNADGLWIALHRISNACELAKQRLNDIKYAKRKEAA